MRPQEINFDLLYQMIFSVPDYMNISSIELEPTMRIHMTSDLNIIKGMEFESSNKELQRLIKRADIARVKEPQQRLQKSNHTMQIKGKK